MASTHRDLSDRGLFTMEETDIRNLLRSNLIYDRAELS